MIKLRKYQSEAIEAVKAAWSASAFSRPAVILPTGTGKTVIFSALARDIFATGTGRVVILVHRDELVTQTVAALTVHASNGWTIGVVKAEQNDVAADVIVASCQTLYRQARIDQLNAGRPIAAILFDEVHHATSESNRRVLDSLGVFATEDAVPAAGFTATFTRTDARKLANDWTPAYEKTMAWAIEHGHLTDLRAIGVRVPDLDLDKAPRTGGDFTDVGLGQQMVDSSASEIVPAAWLEHAKLDDGSYRPTILFAPTIASCDDLVAGFREAGVKTEAVYGTTPTDERRAIYARVADGTTQVLASVGVLTEGFDLPAISCAVMARPTESRGLFQQMAGRIVRLFPGKDDALLLDVIGNTSRHDLCNITDLTKRSDGSVDETTEAGTALCGCGLCCNEKGLRGECTRNKNLGTCYCSCDCPATGDRSSIRLVKGAKDVEVDLFRGSSSVWLRTYRGTWFIPTRVALFCVLPTQDGFRAARTHDVKKASGPFAQWLSVATDLTTAMEVAQVAATQADASVASRSAQWRRGKASEKQVDLAKSLKLDVDGMRRGPVSDAISVYFASRTLGK